MDNMCDAGWWLSHPSEKYELVSWDDEIPICGKKNVPNHQPDYVDQMWKQMLINQYLYYHQMCASSIGHVCL